MCSRCVLGEDRRGLRVQLHVDDGWQAAGHGALQRGRKLIGAGDVLAVAAKPRRREVVAVGSRSQPVSRSGPNWRSCSMCSAFQRASLPITKIAFAPSRTAVSSLAEIKAGGAVAAGADDRRAGPATCAPMALPIALAIAPDAPFITRAGR